MKRKKKNNNNLIIIIAILVVLVIIIGIAIGVNKKKAKNDSTNGITGTSTNESTEENEMTREEEVKTLSESSRMKRYVGIFFEDIENGDYIKAYDHLNEDFKNTYFPRLEDFEEYADKYFNSSLITVTYDNIERLGNNKTGNMYIQWLTIGNIYQRKLAEDEKIEQTNFVIVEYDYNNYEMSFSVVSEE